MTFVVVRTNSAGVHVGELKSHDGTVVTLKEAHRVWRWRGANTLHELSLRGASKEDYTRISEAVQEITLTEAIEIIPVHSDDAIKNLTTPRWLS